MILEKGPFVGTLSKTHGTDGTLILKFDPDFIDILKELELVFIDIDKQPVPFFFEKLDFRNQRTAHVKFLDFDDTEVPEELLGKKIYLPPEYVVSEEQYFEEDVTGFSIKDKYLGKIGSVESLIDHPKNPLLAMQTEYDIEYIPILGNMITKVDYSQKIIYTRLPDGLINH